MPELDKSPDYYGCDSEDTKELGERVCWHSAVYHKSDSNASFLRAARAGNLDKVVEYLKGGIDINTCNQYTREWTMKLLVHLASIKDCQYAATATTTAADQPRDSWVQRTCAPQPGTGIPGKSGEERLTEMEAQMAPFKQEVLGAPVTRI
ncbi:hypothetical protein HPG69_016317 [Diceros bicornis minor]|uniref:Uncharacterized protein n=1 Tax=Diceros bicornis minor TaxID=77932 RepID=A0A7J7F724_DICBM|nr:hypothetical protein HPG69_016317 [Diceros bicornis minor]